MLVSTSHAIVPACSAISPAVISSFPSGPCCAPSTTTSSRMLTPGTSVTSSITMSMETVPAIFAR